MRIPRILNSVLGPLIRDSRARSTPVKFMFQQRGYVKVHIGDDMEVLLDQVMNVCSIDFAEWNEESGERGVEVSQSVEFFVSHP